MSEEARRLLTLVAEVLDVPPERVSLETRAEELEEWDSLGHLRVLLAVEEEFEIAVDMDVAPELDSMNRLLAWLLAARQRG